jgi:hemoglobin
MNAAAASLYELLGGHEPLRALAHRFVAELRALHGEQTLRQMFDAADLAVYEQRLYEFLSGWLGGPPLYMQAHGLPNLRERHRHLAIGTAERDQWLLCMQRALEAAVSAPALRARLLAVFWSMANSLRNRDEAAIQHRPQPAGGPTDALLSRSVADSRSPRTETGAAFAPAARKAATRPLPSSTDKE